VGIESAQEYEPAGRRSTKVGVTKEGP
jgi:hypothetical protein